MDPENKFYCSREPQDSEVVIIKSLLLKINLNEYLQDNFIYILMKATGDFEILSFENDFVFLASKELKVSNKMAIEYLIEKVEIDQAVNKVLFENNIGKYKKFKAVKDEKLTRKGVKKVMSNFSVYASNLPEAAKTLNDIGYFKYLYLYDVSKEEE